MDSRCFGGRFGATGFVPIELIDCIVCKSGLVLVVGNTTFFLQKLQCILVMEAVATFHHENVVVIFCTCGKGALGSSFLKFVWWWQLCYKD
jgi:hypothetical protein